MGLHCFQLSTEQIIELFYQIYNPDESAKERVSDAETLSAPVIIARNEISENTQQPVEQVDSQESIDNADMVEEQQRQIASRRRQEADKTAQTPQGTQPVVGNNTIQSNTTDQLIQQIQQIPSAVDTNNMPIQSAPAQPINTTIQNNGQ
jgi:hypothetical protein